MFLLKDHNAVTPAVQDVILNVHDYKNKNNQSNVPSCAYTGKYVSVKAYMCA